MSHPHAAFGTRTLGVLAFSALILGSAVAGYFFTTASARSAETANSGQATDLAIAPESVIAGSGEVLSAAPAASADESQAQILADGTVTLEEYEGAIQRTAQCLRDAGVDVFVQAGTGLQPSRLGFSAGSDGGRSAGTAALLDCRAKYLNAVEFARAAEVVPDDPAELAEGIRLLSECMLERGAVLPSGVVTSDDLRRWTTNGIAPEMAIRSDCQQELEPVLGYAP